MVLTLKFTTLRLNIRELRITVQLLDPLGSRTSENPAVAGRLGNHHRRLNCPQQAFDARLIIVRTKTHTSIVILLIDAFTRAFVIAVFSPNKRDLHGNVLSMDFNALTGQIIQAENNP